MKLAFKNKQEITNTNLEFGLVLIGIDTCPIHIGLMFKGNFYELTVKGINCYHSLKLFNWIKIKKNYSCLISFKQLNISEEEVLSLFKQFNLDDLNTTCLDPVKNILTTNFKIDFNTAETIFDVLNTIKKNNLVFENYFLGNDEITSFEIKEYNRADVFNFIKVIR